ncbi:MULTISPECIES: helix-turn-helix domain-containing protein [Ahrensia]|uniref:helix-turn-helix domain-containing protein n=1 Tax=Ahrensia TaxID=152180 RepID=UPI0003716145|nr:MULTISPECIES: helix-turn-helix transcriptional regulator [Ahrensia]
MNKLDRAALFRDRVVERLTAAKISRSQLSRDAGIDRSTVAQILNGEDARLPNAHIAAEFAAALGVSADWLLGLSDRSERAAQLLSAGLNFADAQRTPADEQLIAWHREAAGHKIRAVPTTLPDILKTGAMLEWEYELFQDKTPEQASAAMRDTADWLQAPGSDYEICVPIETVKSLARGEGYFEGIPKDVRVEQIMHMAKQCGDLYPSVRLYLFSSRKVHSAPLVIFGPLIAAVYVGQFYMVFRERKQVQGLTRHFDELVRASSVDARSAAQVIRSFL